LNLQPPLYEIIKTEIDRRVATGVWPVNSPVPSETVLATEFGASRLTVRRALRELQTAGVLNRVQGRGTFVLGPRVPCAVFGLIAISEAIAASGGAYSCQMLTHTTLLPDDPNRSMLLVPEGAKVFFSSVLHLEDGTPVQLEERYVHAAEAPRYLEQDFSIRGPDAWLQQATRVTRVENTIRAIRADDALRQRLQIDGNQPCLLLDRSTWRDGVPVTRSRFIYPGDRYRLRSAHDAHITRDELMAGVTGVR
jgi:GntR family histidine utilization transcriptional repressor